MERMSIALARLAEERKQWRKDHPAGFVARPRKKADGSTDLMNWEASIPGKEGNIWEGTEVPLNISFSDSYPVDPPVVRFPGKPVLWHLNVWASGTSTVVLAGLAGLRSACLDCDSDGLFVCCVRRQANSASTSSTRPTKADHGTANGSPRVSAARHPG